MVKSKAPPGYTVPLLHAGVFVCSFVGKTDAFSTTPFTNPVQLRPSSARHPSSYFTKFNYYHSNTRLDVINSDGKISYGEEARPLRRTIYGADDWVKHRDPSRFFDNLLNFFKSGVIVKLLNEVAVVTTAALLIVTFNCLGVDGYTDFDGVKQAPLFDLPSFLLLTLPAVPFTLSSSVLGLLLVFRTNTSYFRWNEARSCWGMVNNHCRNIMRMATSWTLKGATPDNEKERMDALKDLETCIWEFPRSMQRHLLRGAEDEMIFQKEVRERMDPVRAEALIKAPHRPTKAMFDLTNAVDRLPLPYIKRIEIDKSIVVLGDMCGNCERLLTSPVPLVYTRHTARILSLWLLLVPFSLWDPFANTWNHLGMVPCAAAIAFFFFGIEELAVQLEEPFSVLPLSGLTNGIYARAQEYNANHENENLEKMKNYSRDASIKSARAKMKSKHAAMVNVNGTAEMARVAPVSINGANGTSAAQPVNTPLPTQQQQMYPPQPPPEVYPPVPTYDYSGMMNAGKGKNS